MNFLTFYHATATYQSLADAKIFEELIDATLNFCDLRAFELIWFFKELKGSASQVKDAKKQVMEKKFFVPFLSLLRAGRFHF